MQHLLPIGNITKIFFREWRFSFRKKIFVKKKKALLIIFTILKE